MLLTMRHRTFKNFQPGNQIRTKQGEIFEILDRTTYFCKGCDCKPLNPCDKMKEMTNLTIKSQRGIWEMNLQVMNEKYIKQDIDLWG